MGFLTSIDSIVIDGIKVVTVTIIKVTMVIDSIVDIITIVTIMESGSVIIATTDIANASTTLFLVNVNRMV